MKIKILVKACVRYFSLFLKDKCISSLVRTKYIENKFTLQFFLPTISRIFILSWTTTRYPPPWTSCLEKITMCKGLQTSVIHLISGGTCHWISNQMRCFKKNTFGQNISQWQLIAEAGIHGSFLWNLFWKFHKFPRRTSPVSVR